MHIGFRSAAVVLGLLAALSAEAQIAPQQQPAHQLLPAGTTMEIRLTRRIATQQDREGGAVQAVLSAPVMIGNRVVLPLGSTILGTVIKVQSVRFGLVHETAALGLRMDRAILPDATTLKISARVVQLENSREVVGKSGDIQGVRATSTMSHRTAGAIGTLAFSNPIALIFTTASSASLLRFSDPEISLPANAELMLQLTAPLEVVGSDAPETATVADTPAQQQDLRTLVRHQAFRTETDRSHIPSDMTNLMFIGQSEAILRAFTAAGWMQVQVLDAASAYRTVRAISEAQAYQAAPMSTLLLEGQSPRFALAKTLDTFSKRHHLRVFAAQGQWEGQPVWISSSTQDIGIGFAASQKSFIHQIDHNIDHERTKVVNDLLLTGCVTAINMVDRPWLPKDAKNGTGEPIVTDGGMAVLRVNDCTAPLHVPERDQTAALPIQVNAMTRGVRQSVLSLRNSMLRDNIAVTAYSGFRTVTGLRHPTPPEAPLEAQSVISAPQYLLGGERGTTTLVPHGADTPRAIAAPPQPATAGLRFKPYTVELGLHGSFAGYAGGNGSAVGYYLIPDDPTQDQAFVAVLADEHSNGFGLGGSVTLNLHEHFSSEVTFDYNRTGFTVGLATIALDGVEQTDPTSATEFQFDEATLSTTEVAYNALFHLKRRESRFRPYVFAGPSLRLMHLTDAPVTKASPWFRLGLSTIGSITAAYQFGSAPPLDGGGIFQVGLQYGGGVKYRVAPRWLVRADYKETLTSQPNFWSKAEDEILSADFMQNYSLGVFGPDSEGAMRQQRVTAGLSFLF